MNLLELLLVLVVAGLCGAVAELIVGFKPGGVLIAIIIGVIGAYAGNLLASILLQGVPALRYFIVISVGAIEFDLVWATIGSILVTWGLATLRSNRGAHVSQRRV